MPLHHIGGIVANIYAPLASGSRAVYIAKFSAELVLNLDALSPKVTWIYCVPSHLQAILAARTPDTKPPSTVRLYRSGAAALPVAVAEELRAWSGATVLPCVEIKFTEPDTLIDFHTGPSDVLHERMYAYRFPGLFLRPRASLQRRSRRGT